MDIPAFTKYIICPGCHGRKWKRERGGYSMIVCPMCEGKGKIPQMCDGRFIKK